jgi:hypothetical protein
MILRLSVFTLLAISGAQVSAHPGHHPAEYGAGHLVSSPYHLLTLALTGVGLVLVARLVKHRASARWLSVAGFAGVAGAGAGWLLGF